MPLSPRLFRPNASIPECVPKSAVSLPRAIGRARMGRAARVSLTKEEPMPKHVTLALFVVGALLGAALLPAAAAPQLLPDDVVPLHYNLSVMPDASAMTWQGKVV